MRRLRVRAANQQVAAVSKPEVQPEEPMPTEEVDTPGSETIASLAALLGVPTSRTASVKFTDAELLGMPTIVTDSPRSLAAGGVEVTDRATGERGVRPADDVAAELIA